MIKEEITHLIFIRETSSYLKYTSAMCWSIVNEKFSEWLEHDFSLLVDYIRAGNRTEMIL